MKQSQIDTVVTAFRVADAALGATWSIVVRIVEDDAELRTAIRGVQDAWSVLEQCVSKRRIAHERQR